MRQFDFIAINAAFVIVAISMTGCQYSETESNLTHMTDLDRGPLNMSKMSKLVPSSWAKPMPPVDLESWQIEILGKAIALAGRKTKLRRVVVLTLTGDPFNAAALFALTIRNPTIEFITEDLDSHSVSSARFINFVFPLGDVPGQRKASLYISTDRDDQLHLFGFVAQHVGNGWRVDIRSDGLVTLFRSH